MGGQKRYCGKASFASNGACDLMSIGSNSVWGTEKSMAERTRCRIHYFDCTTEEAKMPVAIRDRTVWHQICLGPKDEVIDGRQYMTYASLLRQAKIKRPPSFLKMDIEGYEFPVCRAWSRADSSILPSQIAMKIHASTSSQIGLSWEDRAKAPGELFGFFLNLYALGYRLMHVDRKTMRQGCLEVLLGRVF